MSEAAGRDGVDPGFVERECLLFEAGDYPDRQVCVSAADLVEIAANTADPVPVRVEHLERTPFDGALGVMTRIRADGPRLWGTLRQPEVAWRFVRHAGARALSVGLDTVARRVAEVSFVCRPRVAGARVFSDRVARFDCPGFAADLRGGEEEHMASVRQFADGVAQVIRGALGGCDDASEAVELVAARARLETERAAAAVERAEARLVEFKRRGLMRATPDAEALARAILCGGHAAVATFGEAEMPLAEMFARFMEANGPVVPVGEVAPAMAVASGCASERLMAMAREIVRRDGTPYVLAFSQAASAHPDLARAAREEGAAG